ncbi:MAG: alkaline phosphatase family protein [Planctomycetaceae bacterium]|nr:alkaline phosphatase family protein [Planctomycetaceae bacterium]
MHRRVVIVGFDGLEPSLVESLLAAGELPRFAELRRRGGMSRVETTTPAQTPVAWSTFATGVNPGRHGIFDFLRRNPGTYLPELGLTRYEQKNAFVPPKAVNQRRGRTIWEYLSDADVPSVVIRCPCMYPPAPIKGRVLCGMGVPDVRGGLGTPTFFTTDSQCPPRESENVARLVKAGADRYLGLLPGPHNARKGGSFECELVFHVKHSAQQVTVEGAQPLVIPVGGWSDWLHVSFKTGLLQSVRGMVRLHVRQIEPQLEIYASPVNFEPGAPLFPISSPPEYAAQIERELGTYYTTGMVEDHTGFGNDRIDEHAFLAQCADVYREREAMLLWELERQTDGCVFCLFDTPDRVQHMFWKHHTAAAGDYRDVVAAQYRRCDETLGKVLERAGPETLVIALSDHGFGSFHRGVNLNSWLHEQGLLAFKTGESTTEHGEFFRDVDWSRTQAYAVGLGGIYLNRAGRERNGIVSDSDAAPLARQIADRIAGLVDAPQQGVAVRRARLRDDVYSGELAEEAPDVLVDFAAGYRASWRTALGGAAECVMEDNTRAWAGDHIVDPELVPGVLLMSQPYRGESARLLDMAPTVLKALGLPPQPAFEGQALLA